MKDEREERKELVRLVISLVDGAIESHERLYHTSA